MLVLVLGLGLAEGEGSHIILAALSIEAGGARTEIRPHTTCTATPSTRPFSMS